MIAQLFSLGFLMFSDFIIHVHQVELHLSTILTSSVFFVIGMVGIAVYTNFKSIYDYLDREKITGLEVQLSLRKLLLLFGIFSILVSLISAMACFVLMERISVWKVLFE